MDVVQGQESKAPIKIKFYTQKGEKNGWSA
jgi:hypothetical protein